MKLHVITRKLLGALDVEMRCYFLHGILCAYMPGLYYKGERAPAVKRWFSTRGILSEIQRGLDGFENGGWSRVSNLLTKIFARDNNWNGNEKSLFRLL